MDASIKPNTMNTLRNSRKYCTAESHTVNFKRMFSPISELHFTFKSYMC